VLGERLQAQLRTDEEGGIVLEEPQVREEG
jgi:hypothetical protein